MTAAILAVTIFALMFILIVTEKFELGIGFWRCHARLVCCMENTELGRDRYSDLFVSCRRFRESIDGHQLGYDIFHRGHDGHGRRHGGIRLFQQISSKTDDYKKLEGLRSHGGPIAVRWRRRPYWSLRYV